MAETIYVEHRPGTYKAYKTIGGWTVNYLGVNNTLRSVDGGKIHKKRQNAYAKAKRLNDRLKCVLESTGMAEAEYGSGYIANVQNNQGEFGDQYSLTFRDGEMPPFETTFFNDLETLEHYVFEVLHEPLNWHKVEGEM